MNRYFLLAALGLGLGSPLARADDDDDRLALRLVAVVRDPRLKTTQRAEAAHTLAKIGPKAHAALDELQHQLTLLRKAEQEDLQEAVAEALGAIGAAAKPALPVLAKTTGRSTDIDLAVRGATKQILGSEDRRDLAGLIEQLRSRDEGTRLRAAKVLGTLEAGAVTALPALTAVLSDSDGDVRRAAVAAVRRIQPTAKPSKELIQAYVLDLGDTDDNVRLSTVRTLGKLGPAALDASGPIQNLLTDPDKDVRKAAADALVRITGSS
ncbi:HEAT repeat domain-containing protein [Limnoglobus roseus]|uniref:HEAT repeat domain-containing protein n=1 Tax=Limnoglobus roseus TaxID=2598579 RepID=A0A5C1A4P7_9BACT|nr:HEAT repeat domain-containing protein [Limnoglobus roseus]QEL13303.1 HEAT repeat domain-containing protein [Limnoglobus roseus]